MLSHHTTQPPESSIAERLADSEGFLEGGTFVAAVAIGIAPAVAAAGIMFDAHLLAFGITSGLLLVGFVTAAVSSEL